MLGRGERGLDKGSRRLPLYGSLIITLASAALALLAAGPAAAQSPSGTSGLTRDTLEAIAPVDEDEAPRLEIAGGIERSPCPLAEPRFAAITLTISAVDFQGISPVHAAGLRLAWEPFAGSKVSVSVLCEIRDAAATVLRKQGYIAGVEIPVQKIEDGKVVFQVLLGRVISLRARGETDGAQAKLLAYLSHLESDEPFNRLAAERYLLLARDLPGYDVQLVLKPAGRAPGDLLGEIIVTRRRLAADITVQNLSATATGPWGGQVRLQAAGLTGMGDLTAVSFYSTADFDEQHIVQAMHEFRPGSEGLTLAVQATYARTRPTLGGRPPEAPGIRANTWLAGVQARFPLVRSQRRNLWLASGLDVVNQTVDFIGPLSRDRQRTGWLRLSLDAVDLTRRAPRWRMGAMVEVRRGFALLDASRPCRSQSCTGLTIPTSRVDGSARGSLVRFQAEGQIALGRMQLNLAPRGQYAFDSLLAFEEFSGGNYTVGRGYEPGTILGDHGLGIAAEVRLAPFMLGRTARAQLQPFVFADAVRSWDRGSARSASLLSIGGGLRATLLGRHRLEATMSVPSHESGLQSGLQGRSRALRMLVSLTTAVLPWRKP